MADITEIKKRLEDEVLTIAGELLPKGRREGKFWCAGNTGGDEGSSLRVYLAGRKKGRWADFAADGEGGDLIDLWCQVNRVTLSVALPQIRKRLGIEDPKFEKKAKVYNRPKKPQCNAPKSAVLKYLTEERHLSVEAIQCYRVGENGRDMIFPFLLPDGSLPLVKRRSIDLLPTGKKDVRPTESDCEPVLFGWQVIDPEAREMTIVEGEVDALSAYDYGWPAMSVPFGAGGGAKQQWIESDFERLSQFEVIYLALDMDAEGEAAVTEIANRLGRHRCRRVILPKKDLNECLQAEVPREEIRKCFEDARTLDPPELVQPGAYADSVVNLFWPTDETELGYRLPFTKSSDKLVFRPGEITEWTGSTGAGKSQLLSYALVAMGEQGARICIASLEMAPPQLIRRMVKQAGNVDRPTEPFIRQVIGWLDEWMWMFGLMGKSPVARLIEVFEYARARYDCDVFAIDSLMRLGVSSEDYEGQEKAVFELVNWAVAKSVHIHLVAHARKSDRAASSPIPDAEDIKGTSEIANNAANILGIWRNKRLEEEVRVATETANRGDEGARAKLAEIILKPPVMVNVAKQRNGDWEGRFGLWFNPITYQYRSAQDDRMGRQFVYMTSE